MAFWRTEKSGGGKSFLALDIGTEQIKALVFGIKENKIIVKHKIIERQSPKSMTGGTISDIGEIIKICKKIARESEKLEKNKISKVIFGIAGEPIRGGTEKICFERENAEKDISLPEIENIIQKVQWKIFDKLRKDFMDDAGHLKDRPKVLDAQIFNMEIDGKKILSPISLKGKILSFEIFNSVTSEHNFNIISQLEESIGVDFTRAICIPCAIARLMRSAAVLPSRSLLVDIGGNITDIAIIKNALADSVKTFALGGRCFSKKISEMFKIGEKEAENIKLKYSGGELGKDVSHLIRNALKEDIKVWTRGVKITLERFLKNDFSPTVIYLYGSGSLLPNIKETLQEVFANSKSCYLDVQFLPSDLLCDKIICKGKIEPRYVNCLGIANLFLEEQDNFINQSLQRAIRLLQK